MAHLRNILPVSLDKTTRRFFQRRMCSGQKTETVGVIGLGNMGFGMACNFLKKGYNIKAFDSNKEALKKFELIGGNVASSASEVSSTSDILITMLPNNEIVKSVYLESVLQNSKEGALFIDSSTIDPSISQELASVVSKKKDGSAFVDAPVSGGVNAANTGTLTIMVGAGDSGIFKKAEKVLGAVGKNVIHCGGVGTGQAVKLCNNMLLAISMIGTSEAMNLGKNLGLDTKLLASILSASTGRCWSIDTYNPVPGVMENVPSSNQYKGGFGTSLMTKDLGLCQDAATRTSSATPLGALAYQIYRIICLSGHEDKDFSYAYQILQGQKK